MKNSYCTILLLIIGTIFVNAQKVYRTSYKSEADWQVFFTKYKSEANLKIYFTKYKSEAGMK